LFYRFKNSPQNTFDKDVKTYKYVPCVFFVDIVQFINVGKIIKYIKFKLTLSKYSVGAEIVYYYFLFLIYNSLTTNYSYFYMLRIDHIITYTIDYMQISII